MRPSFSQQVKAELAALTDKKRTGRAAECAALLCMCGNVSFSGVFAPSLSVFTENQAAAEKAFTLLQKTFKISVVSDVRDHPWGGQRKQYVLEASSPEEVRGLLCACGFSACASPDGPSLRVAPLPGDLLAGAAEKRSFLRGAFLAAGTVSDPRKGYRFEIVCPGRERAQQVRELFRACALDPRLADRRDKCVVYLKEGEDISDALGLIGAHRSLLDLENVRVLKEISGDVNRRVNCETANINKTVSAAVGQLEDIRLLEETGRLESLPESLREIAVLRQSMPDASLTELGEALSPPVGKSGVNHRLRKLKAAADEIRAKGGKRT